MGIHTVCQFYGLQTTGGQFTILLSHNAFLTLENSFSAIFFVTRRNNSVQSTTIIEPESILALWWAKTMHGCVDVSPPACELQQYILANPLICAYTLHIYCQFRYLLNQLKVVASGKESILCPSDNCKEPENLYSVKAGVSFHFFSTQIPCMSCTYCSTSRVTLN